MSSIGILPLVVAQANKHAFVGALDFQMNVALKSQPSNDSNCVEQKPLDSGRPLRAKTSTHNPIIAMGETSLPSSKANKLQILSSSQSLRLLTKVKFQWLMPPFQETTCTMAYRKQAILKRS